MEATLSLDPDNEPVSRALQGILLQQQTATHPLPANAEAIAELAEVTDAEVLRGALRHPSDSGGWQLGDIDRSERLGKYRKRMSVFTTHRASTDIGLSEHQTRPQSLSFPNRLTPPYS